MTNLIYEDVEIFKNASEFSTFVQMSAHTNNISCKDFIIRYCETEMIDIEDVIKLLTPNMKDIVEHEFVEEYHIKRKVSVNLNDII